HYECESKLNLVEPSGKKKILYKSIYVANVTGFSVYYRMSLNSISCRFRSDDLKQWSITASHVQQLCYVYFQMFLIIDSSRTDKNSVTSEYHFSTPIIANVWWGVKNLTHTSAIDFINNYHVSMDRSEMKRRINTVRLYNLNYGSENHFVQPVDLSGMGMFGSKLSI
ncbi:hypothetical protein X801_00559, partial [Opisthorchis viverrini]